MKNECQPKFNRKTMSLIILGELENKLPFYLILIIFLLLGACKTGEVTVPQENSEEPVVSEEEEKIVEQRKSDSLAYLSLVQARESEIENYKASETKDFDIIHTDLDLAFDFKRQAVIGKAVLTIKPYFYSQKELVLDAQDFELGRIYLTGGGDSLSLGYRYDQQKIRIYLPDELTKEDTFEISMSYTAFPEQNAGEGSEAITDTKGLYFIDPLDTVPEKPTMIWTQGETEHNSKWFPTRDVPNERFTQLIKLTVQDTLVTISNGELIRQEDLGNGLRKDYWEMTNSHAPYLAALAIGDFGKVSDSWNDIPLGYYVEKGYEKGAAKVFENTPEMVGFFSRILGVDYPWPKYDQIVVRDFVSGAMENTTASIFMEELRLDEREAIDSEWDYIIAHELFHQWFGDYVTTESWSNLTLNEAFANYSEFLWNEHKYGADEAKLKLVTEMENYFAEAEAKQVDLIRFDYRDSEDMFDSHSYSKGGVVLHMLREFLGDEAFFAGLQLYLKDNALQSVEVHDLRLAMEEVSGKDLNWFFNQWFLDKGHPDLSFEIDYSQPENILISVRQNQDLQTTPLYTLPFEVSWYEGEDRKSKKFVLERAFQQFALENEQPVDLVLIDEGKNLLAKRTIEQSTSQYVKQFESSSLGIARYEALDTLTSREAANELELLIPKAIKDEFWAIREFALSYLQSNPAIIDSASGLEETILEIAESDPKNSVRAGAIDVLGNISPDKYQTTFQLMANDSSYLIAGSALMALTSLEEEPLNADFLEEFAEETNFRMVIPVADYYIAESIPNKGGWFFEKANVITGEGFYYFLGYFSEYFIRFPEEGSGQAKEFLYTKMKNDSKSFVRLGAFQGLLGFADDPVVVERLNDLAKQETNNELKMYFNYFLESLKEEN